MMIAIFKRRRGLLWLLSFFGQSIHVTLSMSYSTSREHIIYLLQVSHNKDMFIDTFRNNKSFLLLHSQLFAVFTFPPI